MRVERLSNGARLIDAGVRAPGSEAAGRLFSEICLGGLGKVRLAPRPIAGRTIRSAHVTVSSPLVACMGSQYAGWQIKKDRFFAMGSGPARAMAAVEPLFERYPLKVRGERAVLLLETTTLPEAAVAGMIAERCGVPPAALTLVAARTGSPAGTVQIAARSVETALHKLLELSFDLESIVAGRGTCPVAPGTDDPLRAIGRTNDAVLYGADVTLWVKAKAPDVEAVADRVPACASRDYGGLFHDLFKAHGDFYKIDPLLFSPARITFITAPEGRTISAGRLDETMLARSFGFAG